MTRAEPWNDDLPAFVAGHPEALVVIGAPAAVVIAAFADPVLALVAFLVALVVAVAARASGAPIAETVVAAGLAPLLITAATAALAVLLVVVLVAAADRTARPWPLALGALGWAWPGPEGALLAAPALAILGARSAAPGPHGTRWPLGLALAPVLAAAGAFVAPVAALASLSGLAAGALAVRLRAAPSLGPWVGRQAAWAAAAPALVVLALSSVREVPLPGGSVLVLAWGALGAGALLYLVVMGIEVDLRAQPERRASVVAAAVAFAALVAGAAAAGELRLAATITLASWVWWSSAGAMGLVRICGALQGTPRWVAGLGSVCLVLVALAGRMLTRI